MAEIAKLGGGNLSFAMGWEILGHPTLCGLDGEEGGTCCGIFSIPTPLYTTLPQLPIASCTYSYTLDNLQ